MYRLLLAASLAATLAALAPAAHAAGPEQGDANKKTVLEFYDAAMNQKDFEGGEQ